MPDSNKDNKRQRIACILHLCIIHIQHQQQHQCFHTKCHSICLQMESEYHLHHYHGVVVLDDYDDDEGDDDDVDYHFVLLVIRFLHDAKYG